MRKITSVQILDESTTVVTFDDGVRGYWDASSECGEGFVFAAAACSDFGDNELAPRRRAPDSLIGILARRRVPVRKIFVEPIEYDHSLTPDQYLDRQERARA